MTAHLPVLLWLITLSSLNHVHAADLLKSVHSCPLKHVLKAQPIQASARVFALRKSQISAALSAQVTHVAIVYSGEQVKKGQNLLKLDDREWQLKKQQQIAVMAGLQAQIELSIYQLKQAKQLRQKQSLSEQQVKQRQTELLILQADLQIQTNQAKQIALSLSKTQINAPFTGVITQRLVNLGDWVNPGQVLFELLDPQALEVRAQMNNQQIEQIAHSEQINFKWGKQLFALEFNTVLPQVALKTGLRSVIFTALTHSENQNLPLTGAQGQIELHSKQRYLPFKYILKRDKQQGMMVIEQQKAKFVALNNVQMGRAVLIENQDLTQKVVIFGQQLLQQGEAVETINNTEKCDSDALTPSPSR